MPFAATTLAIASMLLATSCGTGPTGLAAGSPTPTAEPSPSESPSPGPSEPSSTPTGTRGPYSDYIIYRSDDPRTAEDLRFEHPAEWIPWQQDRRPASGWTYTLEYEPEIEPEVEGCPRSFARVEIFVGDETVSVPDPPKEHRRRTIGGEEAAFWIYVSGDPSLEKINAERGREGCLSLFGGADLRHSDLTYGLRIYSTLPSPDYDAAAFDRLLDSLEFLP